MVEVELFSLDMWSFMCVCGPVTTHHNLNQTKNNDLNDETVSILGYFESSETYQKGSFPGFFVLVLFKHICQNLLGVI